MNAFTGASCQVREKRMLEIVEIETAKLRPWERNPRLNEHAVDAVAASIRQFGFNVPILCDQGLRIIAGHVRWKAAKKLHMASVPVIRLQLTETQREAFSIADNKTAELAHWDYPALTDILKDLESEEIELPSLGFSDVELQALLEPEEDFDFSAFADDPLPVADLTHVGLAVKVPIDLKKDIKLATQQYAAKHGITHEDSGIMAGQVFAALLQVTKCRNH